jgi:DNA-binding transcriptional ArsR family regulator
MGRMTRRPPIAAALSRSAPVFAALGDGTRLEIIARLCTNGPQSTMRLTEGATVSRQAVTKHLQALERAGLVRGGRQGRERVWSMSPQRLADVRRCLDEISAQWDEVLGRLRASIEADEDGR